MLLYLEPLLNDIFEEIEAIERTPFAGSIDSYDQQRIRKLCDAKARAQCFPADRKIAILIRGVIGHINATFRWNANTSAMQQLMNVKWDFKDYVGALSQVHYFIAT